MADANQAIEGENRPAITVNFLQRSGGIQVAVKTPTQTKRPPTKAASFYVIARRVVGIPGEPAARWGGLPRLFRRMIVCLFLSQ
jgi:hypothetical protein